MERFDDNGHITAQGFSLLLHGEPDTLSRLELAEHLSFCDECCQKYADLMETEPLFSPPQPVAPNVCGQLRSRKRTIRFRRIFKVGLAASLALGLWSAGLGAGIIPAAPSPDTLNFGAAPAVVEKIAKQQQAMRQTREALTGSDPQEDAATLNMKISRALDNFMRNFTNGGDDPS